MDWLWDEYNRKPTTYPDPIQYCYASDSKSKPRVLMKVIIVGGGPAGLTAAHALHHARIDFVLLEKRKGPFVDQGASLVLSPGTLRIMHQFGLLNRLLAIGAEIQHNKAFTKAGFAFRDTWAFAQIRKKLVFFFTPFLSLSPSRY
jgi:hypothetical protein